MHERAPAFQFYPRDFLSDPDVAAMPAEGVGAYIKLLCYCWCETRIVFDDTMLRKLTGCSEAQWRRVRETVIGLFVQVEDDGRIYLRHKRLDMEREKQSARSRERSASGSRGAELRWSHSSAIAQPIANDSSSSASSSSSAEEKIAATAAPVSKPSKPKAPPDPRATPFLKWFAAESESITHVPYAVEWQRDTAIVKALYKTYSDRQLRELAWTLLHTADDWHDKIGRTIPTLKRQANVLAERRTQTLALYRQSNFRDDQLGLTAEVVS